MTVGDLRILAVCINIEKSMEALKTNNSVELLS